ncbi:MAG: DUF4215 domain-containing protein, partial [Kofleriaceae bacterium]
MKRFLVLAILVACAHQNGSGDDDDDGSNSPPGCGDSMISGTEQCDDGNTADGDGCAHDCTLEGGITPSC